MHDTTHTTLHRTREYTTDDCRRKFYRLFPTDADINTSCKFLSLLKQEWQGLLYHLDIREWGALGGEPTVENIYIMWPWARKIARVRRCL